MQLTGAQALVRSLEQQGVEVVFGLPGGTIMPTYDPLLSSSLRHILVRHEQGAGHAAEGYAWATGRTGVCIATSGPGATNLVTALADAYMDSVPIVAITGQVPSPLIGSDAFQEADITGITLPVTKLVAPLPSPTPTPTRKRSRSRCHRLTAGDEMPGAPDGPVSLKWSRPDGLSWPRLCACVSATWNGRIGV